MTQANTGKLIIWTVLSLIVLLIIYGICFQWLDLPIYKALHHSLLGTGFQKFCLHIQHIFSTKIWAIAMILFGALGLLLAIFTQQGQSAYKYLLFAGSLLLAFIVAEILKVALGRYRPDEYYSHGLYGFHYLSIKYQYNSTPSGHTVAAFAGFGSLARIVKKPFWQGLFIILAILIALSRLGALSHYLSDIILGAYIGILSVFWCEQVLRYICQVKTSAKNKL